MERKKLKTVSKIAWTVGDASSLDITDKHAYVVVIANGLGEEVPLDIRKIKKDDAVDSGYVPDGWPLRKLRITVEEIDG